MRKVSFATLAACVIPTLALALPANANAAVVFDTNLASPGVYYGSGNPNGNFTVTTEPVGSGTVELGQRAIQRFVGPIAPQASTNIYNVLTGPTSVPLKTGSDWGFVFSVNLDASGLQLDDVVPLLTLTDVGTGGGNTPFNLLLIPDNGHITPSGTQFDCSKPGLTCDNTVDTGLQNSEALQFSAPADFATFLGDPAYDINANDTYFFRLDLFGLASCSPTCTGDPLATNTIEVIAGTGAEAVPEPGTLALFGAGLIGLVGFGTMRRRSPKA